MSAALVKSQIVLNRTDKVRGEYDNLDRSSLEDQEFTSVYLHEQQFVDFGEPAQITLTIERGDTLNEVESVCVLDEDGDLWVQAPNGNFHLAGGTVDPEDACVPLEEIASQWGIVDDGVLTTFVSQEA